MRIGLLLIGDELLNGSRQDKHLATMIGMLKARGLSLSWVRILGDERALLIQQLQQSLGSGDLVFSFGGIGATPDDLTRECAAYAAGLPLVRHPESVAILEDCFGEHAYPNRIRMAELPEGCNLVGNPVNRVPGFSVRHHYFLPGFPNMAWPMAEGVLDQHYAHLFHQKTYAEQRWKLYHQRESELIPMMETILKRYSDVNISSLPSTKDWHVIDFGIKGEADAVAEAVSWFEVWLAEQQIEHEKVQYG